MLIDADVGDTTIVVSTGDDAYVVLYVEYTRESPDRIDQLLVPILVAVVLVGTSPSSRSI
jgi:hypothetical protein